MTETLKAEFSILGDDRRVVGSIQLSRVACPGCEATIRLRIQVGNEAHQNFYFVCSTCGAATRGELRSGEDLELSLIIAGARFLEDLPDVDQGITIATDLPAIVDAAKMSDPGGSPFILGVELMGDDRFLDYRDRIEQYEETMAGWPSLRRLIGYYEASDWGYFDTEAERITEASPPTASDEPWARHDYLHRLLDVAFAPLWTHRSYPDMKAELWQRVTTAPQPDRVLAFAAAMARDAGFSQDRHVMFGTLNLFVEARKAMLPALSVELMPEERIASLRIMRDDYGQLRDLYLNAFETSHKVLAYVFGLLNSAERGNPDDFASPPLHLHRTSGLFRGCLVPERPYN